MIHLLGPSNPNVVYKPQTPRAKHFWDFIILFNLSYDYVENEFLLVKNGARDPDMWANTSFGPK